VATKCKRFLCCFALQFLLAGFIFTSSYSHTVMPGRAPSPQRSTQSVFTTQSLKLLTVAESAPDQHEAAFVVQHSPAFSPDHLSIYHLMGATSAQSLLYTNIRKQLFAGALLLPVIARTLGLSTLVLRE
jgi:hypothetical protein